VISSVLIFLSLINAFANGVYSIQTTVDPVVFDGDTAIRIASSHPDEPSLAIAGASGLYASEDGGWSKIGPAPPDGEIAWAGGDSGLMLAGDHAPCMRGGPPSDLFRSSDGGASWSAVDGVTEVRPLAIWEKPAIALGASCPGLQVSRDDGVSWSLVPGIEQGWELTAFAEIPQADGGPVVLVGLTGEGGTTYLRSIDFSDPATPVVSSELRIYYALGGLAGFDDTYVLAAIDGVWISDDAGSVWERSAVGLEEVVLEQDPAQSGFPEDLDPRNFGLFAAVILSGEKPGMAVGSVDGLYVRWDDRELWTKVDGTAGRVHQIAASADASLIVYATDEGVFQVDIADSP